MKREILFDKVMRNPASWGDNMNVDVMLENHEKLKKIKNKMFFSEWPKHPTLFVELFSNPTFADKLIDIMIRLGITNLEKVVFTEYGEDDKRKLVEIGILEKELIEIGTPIVIYCHCNQICYVNLVL